MSELVPGDKQRRTCLREQIAKQEQLLEQSSDQIGRLMIEATLAAYRYELSHYVMIDALIEIAVRNGPRKPDSDSTGWDPVSYVADRASDSRRYDGSAAFGSAFTYCTAARALGIL